MLTTIQGDTPSILTNIPNVGQAAPVIPMPIPAAEVNQSTVVGNNKVPVRGIVAALNQYDPDDDSDFKTWYFDDENILDVNPFVGAAEYSDLFGINFKKIGGFLGGLGKGYVQNFTPFGRFIFKHSKFTGEDSDVECFVGVTVSEVSPAMREILERAAASKVLHVPARITANVWFRDQLAETDSSFDGDEYNDFDGLDMDSLQSHQAFFNGLTADEQDEYSDLFGINFKKIGQALGKAVKGIGKGIGAAGKLVGKVGKGIGKGALAVGKLGVKAVKGGLKIAAAASGLGDIFGASADQSNGVTLPANWGAGAAANPDFDPQMYAPEAYNPADGDQDLYNQQIDDLADQGYAPTEDELANGAAALPYVPVESHSNLWLWIALAAFLGLGIYLVHAKKIKI